MKRILVVDDLQDNRFSLNLVLETYVEPIETVEASSGQEALSILGEDTSFSCIFLDIQMPGIDGYETCRRIRGEFQQLYIPVILITSYSLSPEERAKGYDAGCDDFVSKPFDMGELFARLRSVLRIKELTDSLRRERDALGRRVGEQTEIIRRGESELEMSMERYRAVFQNALTVIVCLTQKGEIRDWNRAAQRLFSVTHKEAVGQNFVERYAATDEMKALIGERFHQVACGEYFDECEIDVLTGDQSVRKLSVNLSSFFFPENQETGIILIGSDITEQKKLQHRLRRAERLESIGTLAGGIAHDFNNVLAAIMGNLEMAMEVSKDGEDPKRYLNEIMKASLRSRDLVRQILTFCRKTDEVKEPILLSPVIKEALGLLRPSLPSSIIIEDTVSKDFTPIVGSASQVHEVVMNVCTNAAHAMDGKGTLTIGLDEISFKKPIKTQTGLLEPGRYTKIFVSDTGKGMTRELVDRIFEPFFTTKGPDEGTGMGLAMVHGIVEDHGGHMVVNTAPNKGTTFEIYFPQAPQRAYENTIDVAGEQPLENRVSVLFVDDEPMIAQVGRDMLRSLGYHIEIFTDAHSAFDRFSNSPLAFDVVVTDLTMPGMTGVELGEKIMTIRPEIPVIICTGYSVNLDEATAKHKGFATLLNKPLIRKEMHHAIREALAVKDEASF